MKLEVFAYYPFPEPKITQKGTELLGTIHLFVEDLNLDIKFILCERMKNGHYRCYLPSRKVKDGDSIIRVPILDFTKPTMKDTIIKFCRKYLRNYYAPKTES